MKLATYSQTDGSARIGVVDETSGTILDLLAAEGGEAAEFTSMLALIESGAQGLDKARAVLAKRYGDSTVTHRLADVTLLAPVPVPPQIRDFTVFPGHIRGAPAGMARLAARLRGDEAAALAIKPLEEIPLIYRRQPIYYISNRFSVIGPDSDVLWPRYSSLMDFELEFGVFLGKGGKNIAAAEAAEYIFGYTIYNDFSARDTQFQEMQGMLGPAKGKSFDFGNAMGPWIVTPDEVGDPSHLKLSALVNGETWAQGDASEMLHSFADMISFCSTDETLHPGEFFGSGTMGGGCGLELDRFLADGDVVEIEVEGIGTLRNRVVRPKNAGRRAF